MSFSAADFFDILTLQGLDHFGLWLIWTSIFILWHVLSIRMTQLATTSTTPRVQPTFRSQSYSVSISTCNLSYFDVLEQLNQSGSGLIWIAFHISRQILHALQAQLAACTRTPGVHVALNIHGNCMAITSCNLIYSFIPQLFNFKRVWLKGITFSVFGHLGDDFAWVAELAHFTRAPSIQIPFFIVMDLVLLNEEFVLVDNMSLIKLLNHARADQCQTRRGGWSCWCVDASRSSHRLLLVSNLIWIRCMERALIGLLVTASESWPQGSLSVACEHQYLLVVVVFQSSRRNC